MESTRKRKAGLINEVERSKSWGSSVLRAVRQLAWTGLEARVTELADALVLAPGIEVLALLDGEGRPHGVLTRERLFSLLGKPFGRDVLGRSAARELLEPARLLDANRDVFSVAAELMGRVGAEGTEGVDPRSEAGAGGSAWALLVDAEGRFRGSVRAADLAAWLSRMTQDDVELAGNLQERLVAGSERFDRPGYRGEAWSRPAKGVGGDLWFARPLGGDRSFLALCDISGKGVAASLVVAMVWGMLRAFDLGRGLPALLVELNDAVLSSFHTEKYLTGVFLVVDPRAGRVLLADMGHAHLALLRGGRAQPVRTPRANLPLGIERELEPAVFALRLVPGDGLLVYSDGIPEQENPEGEEFGEAGLLGRAAAILAAGGDLGRELPPLIDAHRAGSPQQDDMTFLWLETRRGEGGWGSR